MGPLILLLYWLVSLYTIVILVRAVMSWIPLRTGTTAYRVYGVVYDVTEPYLRVIRRFVPPVRTGNAAVDLSPLIGLVILFVVQQVLVRL
jgi:YggT family protein